MGLNDADLGELNEVLLQSGLPTFDGRMLAIGGGGFAVRGRTLMLGGEGYGLITSDNVAGGRDYRLGGGYGLFQIGYLGEVTSGFDLFPLAGIGAGGMTLDVGPEGRPGEFDEVLADPDRESRLTRGGILVSAGAGARYRFGGTRSGGPTLGVRAGYLFQPWSTNWQLGGNTVANGPDSSLEGFYLRVTIGGGR
ncbi:MAG: hypothetical protein EA352_12050 [Gemmatimonadales bacterium]|nr:MAG: hypothetical protein EA352_12050 [Gemmatimonadales bacterium]